MKTYYYALGFLLVLFVSCKGEATETFKTWKVSFNVNGGSPVSPLDKVTDRTTIKKPIDPGKLNSVFGGWFTDNGTFLREWDFSKNLVVSDTTLHAKWASTAKTWTVKFNSNGGSLISSVSKVENGSVISRPTDPTKSQFVFNGWFADNISFEKQWDFNQSRVNSDTTLYAKWMPAAGQNKVYDNTVGLVPDCADPYILKYNGMYYLYGTGGNDGIKVYQSSDMITWSKAVGATSGYALHKNSVWGEKWFWAPEVYYLNGKFYMFYSAEEEISLAESTSPLGPFTQSEANQKPFHADIKEIDTHLFVDDDGKKYLYFVRFTNGNEIWVAELNDDMYSIKESTLKRCIGASLGLQTWEKSTLEPQPGAKVNEGPFVLKRNGWYYLTYSANHYQNPNYGVGYATSKSPMGPWTKYSGNPILIGNSKIRGTGHHSFVNVTNGCQYIVYHSHYSPTQVSPRKLGIDMYEFVSASEPGAPDIIKVHGPTTTPQILCTE